jgi:hypothetical protein
MGSNAMQNIFLLAFGKGQLGNDGLCHAGAFFSMANGTVGIILAAPPNIMQVGGHQQYIQIDTLGRSQVFTQPENSEGMIPIVAAPGALKVFAGHFLYGIEHKALLGTLSIK